MGVDQMSAVQMVEHILQEYRTLDCSCCNKFFGYIHRQTGAIYCSSICLATGSNGPTGHTVPFGLGHPFLPAQSPLSPQQILAVTNYVGHSEANGVVHPLQPQVPTKETTQSRESVALNVAQYSIKKELKEDIEVARKQILKIMSSRESEKQVIRSRSNKPEDTDSVNNKRSCFVGEEIRKVTRMCSDDKTTPFISKGRDEQRKVDKEEAECSNTKPILAGSDPCVAERAESPVGRINPFGKTSAETPFKTPVAVPESKNIIRIVSIGPKVENVNFTVKPFPKLDRVPMKIECPLPPFKSAPVAQRKKIKFKNCEYSPLLQDGNNVKISYAWDTIKYLIISPDDEDVIFNLQIIVNESIDSAKSFENVPDVGEVVLAQYFQEYYRAKVVSHEPGDKVKVMFFDFGDTMSVNFGELFEPSDEVMKYPIYAMSVQLDGVPEVKESVTLDHKTIALLSSTMQLQIKKRPEGDSDVFFVTLHKESETLNRIIKRSILNSVGNR